MCLLIVQPGTKITAFAQISYCESNRYTCNFKMRKLTIQKVHVKQIYMLAIYARGLENKESI